MLSPMTTPFPVGVLRDTNRARSNTHGNNEHQRQTCCRRGNTRPAHWRARVPTCPFHFRGSHVAIPRFGVKGHGRAAGDMRSLEAAARVERRSGSRCHSRDHKAAIDAVESNTNTHGHNTRVSFPRFGRIGAWSIGHFGGHKATRPVARRQHSLGSHPGRGRDHVGTSHTRGFSPHSMVWGVVSRATSHIGHNAVCQRTNSFHPQKGLAKTVAVPFLSGMGRGRSVWRVWNPVLGALSPGLSARQPVETRPTEVDTMSKTEIADGLAPHADTFERVAEETDDLAQSDALRVIAAVARGEKAPKRVAERIKDRAGVNHETKLA